jgi:hypothetical protein
MLLLEAFEEAGWRRIDDPLPPQKGVSSPRRLRQTVRNLNRGLRPRLIVFRVEADGRGVYWVPAAHPRAEENGAA